jgi:hypothetical protein
LSADEAFSKSAKRPPVTVATASSATDLSISCSINQHTASSSEISGTSIGAIARDQADVDVDESKGSVRPPIATKIMRITFLSAIFIANSCS